MTARIIDGKAIAEKIRGEIAAQTAEFVRQTGCVPHLAAILVGDDPGMPSTCAANKRPAKRLD